MKNLRAGSPDQDGADVALDVEAALERMGNDHEMYREISHYFAENLPRSLQSLAEALRDGRSEEGRRLAHSLKGNCATVGAGELREHCYELEKLFRDQKLEAARGSYEKLVPRLGVLRDKLLAL